VGVGNLPGMYEMNLLYHPSRSTSYASCFESAGLAAFCSWIAHQYRRTPRNSSECLRLERRTPAQLPNPWKMRDGAHFPISVYIAASASAIDTTSRPIGRWTFGLRRRCPLMHQRKPSCPAGRLRWSLGLSGAPGSPQVSTAHRRTRHYG
jgi:hypothetical protein